MKRTLYLKILIAYFIFGVFGFVIVATFMQQMTTKQLQKSKAEELYNAATILADTEATDLYKNEVSLTTVKTDIDVLSKIIKARIQLLNPSGLIVLDSASDINIDDPASVNGFDITKLSGSFYSIGRFYDQFASDHLSVAAPVTTNYTVRGYVIIHYDISLLNSSTNTLVNIDYIMLLILFLLSLIILIFFSELVYGPLLRIITATEQYAAGNLRYEISIESDDEIGYLAASLSYMAQELAKGEDNQKHLVANVSHDFRSPLTSIKGYLEAMKDGTIPEEMYPKYIGIVINETDRLIKLTNSLLTLNNLNTQGMILEKSSFDINSIIRKTLSTFEGGCRDKKISIKLSLTGEKLLVYADLSRIQQVLYNLIDNAIKFSHRNSSITIDTSVRHNKVFVSVKDSGIGIPKDSVPLVFDRFYKTDISRGKDKKGTGLGLSITREIIRAHGENINVISTEGVGSEFIFSLPLSSEDDDEEDDI